MGVWHYNERFKILGLVLDTRVSYQYVIDPAFTREFDNASVYSLGFRTVF